MLMQLVTLLSLVLLDQETFGEYLALFLNSSIPPRFNGPEVLTSSKDKANLFLGKVSANSTLGDTAVHSLPDFSSRTEQNFCITVRMVINAVYVNLICLKSLVLPVYHLVS